MAVTTERSHHAKVYPHPFTGYHLIDRFPGLFVFCTWSFVQQGDRVRSYNVIMEIAEIFELDEEHQAIRLPEGFTFEGNRVYLKRVGNSIVLLPYNKPWETLVESLTTFSDDFMNERNQQ